MDFEDIVIGSGLSALGTVLGLARSPSVLVVAGPAQADYQYYDARRSVPCAYPGLGGLGNDWHGVIPMSGHPLFAPTRTADFKAWFEHFYPHASVAAQQGQASLFVPWKPIRPRREFERLAAQRPGRLRIEPAMARGFDSTAAGVVVDVEGRKLRGRRLWIGAGALHTPALISAAAGRTVGRGTVSDHITCYIGMTGDRHRPRIARHRNGLYFPAFYDAGHTSLYTLRPARFAFKTLDHAIEARAVFGMPTGHAIAKIARRASPALLAEAFYNRFGLWASAPQYSVMAQTRVTDAYECASGNGLLAPRPEAFHAASAAARAAQPFGADLALSRRPDLHIPGIHLHASIDPAQLHALGIDQAGAAVQVIDASTLQDIGPDHHSFKMLVAAAQRAQASLAP